MAEISCGHREVADTHVEVRNLLVRDLEKVFQQIKLVHQLHGRRVNGVAAKVAQKVGVLLQHHDADAGARQEEAQHHAGGAAADNATAGVDHCGGHGPSAISTNANGPGRDPFRSAGAHRPAAPPSARGSCAPSSVPSGWRTTAPAWPMVSE